MPTLTETVKVPASQAAAGDLFRSTKSGQGTVIGAVTLSEGDTQGRQRIQLRHADGSMIRSCAPETEIWLTRELDEAGEPILSEPDPVDVALEDFEADNGRPATDEERAEIEGAVARLTDAVGETYEPPSEESEPTEEKPRSKKGAWKFLPDAEKAEYLLAHPTLADSAWTDVPRQKGEKRDAFIQRVLLGIVAHEETPDAEDEEAPETGTVTDADLQRLLNAPFAGGTETE